MNRFLIALVFLFTLNAHAQDDTTYRKPLRKFINYVKRNQRDKLAGMVRYPLYRDYPLPVIADKTDFLKRFDEVFDAKLVKAISGSGILTDWERVGWSGIMFQNGDVWVDYDGSLMAVNYQSAAEKERREKLVSEDRAALHRSLKTYQAPVCVLETAKYRVRVDKLGEGNYRYASWPVKSKMSDAPELVIENGKLDFDGSGGNHTYQFKNAGYTYNCYVIIMGTKDSPPAMLTILKGDKTVLAQKASLKGR